MFFIIQDDLLNSKLQVMLARDNACINVIKSKAIGEVKREKNWYIIIKPLNEVTARDKGWTFPYICWIMAAKHRHLKKQYMHYVKINQN